MARTQASSHPFALLLDPESVLKAMESSQRLEHLNRRICRPLDKPLLPVKGNECGVDDAGDDVGGVDADDRLEH